MTPSFDEKAVARLRKAAEKSVRQGAPAAHELARRRLAEAISSMLDLDLTDLITGAWSNTDEIAEAAERTRREPGTEAGVAVGKLAYTARHDAVLEASVDGVPLPELPVALDLDLDMRSVDLTLRAGCLTQIRSGTCTVTATLSLDTVPLPAVQHNLDLKKTISLQQPIPLCHPPQAERQRRASAAGSPPSSDLA